MNPEEKEARMAASSSGIVFPRTASRPGGWWASGCCT